MTTLFLGYPEQPRAQAEVMRRFAASVAARHDLEPVRWEDLRVDGTLVVNTVLSAIEAAEMAIFDLTIPNPNVLYELGFAIGRGKRVWVAIDKTDVRSSTNWNELAILKPLGYTEYRNSAELRSRFEAIDPLNNLEAAYDTLIEPSLPEVPSPRDSILFCTTFQPFEAANRLNTFIERRRRRGVNVIVSDPSESSLTTLTWFAPRVAASAGVLVHFAGQHRNRSKVHNNRHALIAGLATGFDTPLLMLAEEDYPAPFDYETKLRVYETPEECVSEARVWLDGLEFERTTWAIPRRSKAHPLARVRFGEHVAENERHELQDYFVETSAFHDVVRARDSIFIGHRGTGKTANAILAYQRLAANKDNTAVLIKPAGLEFPAITAVIERLPEFQHDYFFDSLWRFVIQTEIGATLLQRLEERSAYVPYGDQESRFLEYVASAPFDMRADISTRIEQALGSLLATLGDDARTDSAGRNQINEAFHSNALVELRAQLGSTLKGKKRVAVLVDNLDKGWERGADFGLMARLVLGLLTARGRVVTDFERQDYWRDAIKLTVAVFLRSDIYAYLRKEAREPDKLPVSSVAWRDRDTLLNVIEARFMACEAAPKSIAELWTTYFAPNVRGIPTRQYLASVTLPRPRDIVFFSNAAVGWAVDRGHDSVLEMDFLSAEETYSQYAYEALLVEDGITVPEMEEAVLAFIGAQRIATTRERRQTLGGLGVGDDRLDRLLEKLLSSSFFGLEVATEQFEYPEVGTQSTLAAARAGKIEPDGEERRLEIHPAFHPFLGIAGGV